MSALNNPDKQALNADQHLRTYGKIILQNKAYN
jgi:hypothetical protein